MSRFDIEDDAAADYQRLMDMCLRDGRRIGTIVAAMPEEYQRMMTTIHMQGYLSGMEKAYDNAQKIINKH